MYSFIFVNLSKKLAERYQERIVFLHNMIPFQNWKKDDLFSSGDGKRNFKYKWEISSVATLNDEPVGMCIAFHDNKSTTLEFSNFLYIHRMSVDPLFRRMGIGRKLFNLTCESYRRISIPSSKFVIAQTPREDFSNKGNSIFYQKIGMEIAGEKHYQNRVDSVFVGNLR